MKKRTREQVLDNKLRRARGIASENSYLLYFATTSPSAFEQIADRELNALIRGREHILFFEWCSRNGLTRRDLWCAADGEPFETLSTRYGVLARISQDRVMAFTNLKSDTGKYLKHIGPDEPEGTREGRYSPSVSARAVEAAAILSGVATIRGDQVVVLHARFTNPVGRDASGRATRYLRVYASREPRPKRAGKQGQRRQGFQVRHHGFPLSEADVQHALGGRFAMVKAMALPLP